jgi:hypothetical protein
MKDDTTLPGGWPAIPASGGTRWVPSSPAEANFTQPPFSAHRTDSTEGPPNNQRCIIPLGRTTFRPCPAGGGIP